MAKIPTLAGSIVASAGGIFVGSKIVFSGTSGEADVIGLQSHEYNDSETLHQQLTRENYFLNLPQAWDMGAQIKDVSEIGGDNLNFSSYKCFENFFPGAKIENTHASENETRRVKLSNEQEEVSESPSKKPPIGCSTMQLSYLPGQSNGKNIVKGMLFKSEIVAKNENEGLALWAVWDARDGVGEYSKDWKQSLNYRFAYLSKNENETWEVKRGYEWEDAVSVITNISAYIKVPNEDLWLDTKNLDVSEPDVWKYKEFSGIWRDEVYETGKKGIFNDMEVRMEDANKCEVMCDNFYIFSERGNWDIGIEYAKYHYAPKQQKWFAIKGDEDKKKVPKLLDKSYDWLKGKVGKWENLKDVCSSYSNSKADYDDDGSIKEELRNFCYSRKETNLRK